MQSELKRLKQLEEEDGRLKRILSDLTLDGEMLQDLIKRKPSGLSGVACSWIICGPPSRLASDGRAECNRRNVSAMITGASGWTPSC